MNKNYKKLTIKLKPKIIKIKNQNKKIIYQKKNRIILSNPKYYNQINKSDNSKLNLNNVV